MCIHIYIYINRDWRMRLQRRGSARMSRRGTLSCMDAWHGDLTIISPTMISKTLEFQKRNLNFTPLARCVKNIKGCLSEHIVGESIATSPYYHECMLMTWVGRRTPGLRAEAGVDQGQAAVPQGVHAEDGRQQESGSPKTWPQPRFQYVSRQKNE